MRNKNAMQIGKWVVAAALAVPCGSVMAATIASDNASDTAYDTPNFFTTGTNGGTGFGAWTITNTGGSGTFIGTSNGNDAFGGVGNINVSNESWGLFGSGSGGTTAARSFTGGDLSIGQSFLISADNGGVEDTGRRVGFALTDAGGNRRFEFAFVGGNGGGYRLFDNGTQNTTTTFSTRGYATIFTLTGVDVYTFDVVFNNIGGGTTTESFTGTLGGTSGNGLTGFVAFNNNNQGGSNFDFFVNSVAVGPEPTSLAALAIGALTLLRRRQA